MTEAWHKLPQSARDGSRVGVRAEQRPLSAAGGTVTPHAHRDAPQPQCAPAWTDCGSRLPRFRDPPAAVSLERQQGRLPPLVRAISLSDGASHVAARAAAFQVPAGDYADFASRWPNDQVAFVSGGRNASHLRTARELLTSTYDLVGKASNPAGLLDALRRLLRWPLWAQLATTATAGPAAGPAAPPFSLSEDEWATLRARAGSTMYSSPPFARVSSAAPLAEVRCASCHALICNIRGRLPRRRRRLPRPRGAGAPASA